MNPFNSIFQIISRFVLNEPPSRPAPSSPQGGSGAGAAPAQGLPQPPPGMSVYAVKRVIGETQWSPEQLEQVRLLRKYVGGYIYFFLMGDILLHVCCSKSNELK